jgi:UDP-3-O-[3-hydroxymyristoyl] glucosamine N-acyltransferase LpxD
LQSARASEIARFLGAELRNGDMVVDRVRPLDEAEDGALVFAVDCTADVAHRLNGIGRIFAIVAADGASLLNICHVVVARPRLAFARTVAAFFMPPPAKPSIAPTAIIGQNVRIGEEVSIGHYSVIGDNVSIGDRTEIRHHVVIAPSVTIGSDCLIKSHAVVGEEGFGVAYDEEERTFRIPHIGRLVIGDRVEIGALNSVCRATIGVTSIGDGVKADDHVHFSHNCTVGDDSIFTAQSEVGAQVRVGHHAWFGPNSCTLEKITVEPWGFVGIGATVTRDVKEHTIVAGNPARRVGSRE